jgi:hypothetical protein
MIARVARITVLLAVALSTAVRAGAAPPSGDLDALKKLAGHWQGKAKMGAGGQEVPVVLTYEVTAGGSAVLERLFPGTPHEMISVYTMDGDKLAMTHYCAMGNHPKMVLKKAGAAEMAFELAGTDGLRSAGEPHMHAMTIAFTDGGHIRETWVSFDKGVKKEEKTFDLARAN